MWTDLSSKLDQLRVQINQDTQSLLEPLFLGCRMSRAAVLTGSSETMDKPVRQKELDSEISKTKEMVQTVRNDNLKAFEEIRPASGTE